MTKDDTTIVEGAGSEEDVQGRINQIKAEIDNTDSDWDSEKLQERLAKLAGGVAVIKVGAATEVELKEKKHRIEDAVVGDPRGGRGGHRPRRRRHADPRRGGPRQARPRRATRRRARTSSATPSPSRPRRIAQNAGYEGAVIVEQIRTEGDGRGFDAATGEWVDMVKAGIIDPAEGHPLGAAERRLHRGHRAHRGVRGGREARGGRARRPRAARHMH